MIWFLSFLAFFPLPTPTRTTVSPVQQELYCLISAVSLTPSRLRGTWWRLNICLRMNKCFAQGVKHIFCPCGIQWASPGLASSTVRAKSWGTLGQWSQNLTAHQSCLWESVKMQIQRPTTGPWNHSLWHFDFDSFQKSVGVFASHDDSQAVTETAVNLHLRTPSVHEATGRGRHLSCSLLGSQGVAQGLACGHQQWTVVECMWEALPFLRGVLNCRGLLRYWNSFLGPPWNPKLISLFACITGQFNLSEPQIFL